MFSIEDVWQGCKYVSGPYISIYGMKAEPFHT